MSRSHYLMVPVSAQGVIVDPGTKDILQAAMADPFAHTDVFLYSHGWWTRAESAMVDYNRFIMGFGAVGIALDAAAGGVARAVLGIGVHWPSMVSEDSNSPLTVLQPFTYFNRAKMADDVGEHGTYSILRLMLEARRDAGIAPPRFHLIGHSFGCKVVCAALEGLATTVAPSGLLAGVTLNVVLLQAAFDNDALEPGRSYGHVLSALPTTRFLVSTSTLDTAVGDEYVLVQKVMNLFGTPTKGLGAAGPSAGTAAAAGGSTALVVGPGFTPPARSTLAGRLVVADLSTLHAANPSHAVRFSGQHSDIYYNEIYRLIAAFIGLG